MINFSCQSTKGTSEITTKTEPLVFYSKGPCRGKCSVYDLRIYKDGSISYFGIDHVIVKGDLQSKLEDQELKELKAMLKRGEHKNPNFKRVLDWSVTTLRINGEEYRYYPSTVSGFVKELDVKLRKIVHRIIHNPNVQSEEG
ncbi:DUF6438 domain-containing protein [Aquimarina sediminis]|uniref:DUF6438 domain-containing protein n=1 Tax=Aquimarina sediminis TaxID=2070536 RepID=UPI000FFF25AF|nr:DUF6438 domain-containing protein [Aquimarina sediminis]